MSVVTLSELIERKERIEALIRQFNKQWPGHCVSAVVWKLPTLTEQEAPDEICLKQFKGPDAIELAMQSLLRFSRQPSQHPATAIRLPGIMRMSRHFYAEAAEINARKDDLKQRMQSIHPRSRPKYASTAWPNVSALQLYRHIAAPYSVKRKVLFSWIGHTTSSTRTTRDKMIESVNLARPLVPTNVTESDWNAVIDKETRELASLPANAHLVLQKQVAPHPRMMMYHAKDKQPTRTYGANLPLFIPEHPGMVVRELTDWSRTEALQRKRRKDKLPSTPVIPRINLYLREG